MKSVAAFENAAPNNYPFLQFATHGVQVFPYTQTRMKRVYIQYSFNTRLGK
jgi:hypothetical protein